MTEQERVAYFEAEATRVEAISNLAKQANEGVDLRAELLLFKTDDSELLKRVEAVDERLLKFLLRSIDNVPKEKQSSLIYTDENGFTKHPHIKRKW